MGSILTETKSFDIPIRNNLIRYVRAIDATRNQYGLIIKFKEFISKYLSLISGNFYIEKSADFNNNENVMSQNGYNYFKTTESLNSYTVYAVAKIVYTHSDVPANYVFKSGTEDYYLCLANSAFNLFSGKTGEIIMPINYPMIDKVCLVTFQRGKIFINNVLQTELNYNQSQISAFTVKYFFSLGGGNKIAEAMIYNVEHNTTEMLSMWNYFNLKYNIERTYTDLIFHLDASQGITVINDGVHDRVDSWADQSTRQKDAVATSSTTRPIYISSDSEFNNMPVIYCDQIYEMVHLPVTARYYTYHIVLQIEPGSSGNIGYFHSGYSQSHLFLADNSYKLLTYQTRSSGSSGIIQRSSLAPTIPFVATFTNNKILINGVEVTYTTNLREVWGNLGLRKLFNYIPSNYFLGKIAEIQVFESIHSDATILIEAQALMTKYGIL
jgi:hypothetical protein